MPVKLHDGDDPRYFRRTPFPPTHDRASLRRATTDDPPLDESHAGRYNPYNYGYAPTPKPVVALPEPELEPEPAPEPAPEPELAPIAEVAAPVAAIEPIEEPVVLVIPDEERQPDVEVRMRKPFWPRWSRRSRSEKARDLTDPSGRTESYS